MTTADITRDPPRDLTLALRVDDLHKTFGAQPVVRGLNLELPVGSLTAVLGPSGCGKTTLLRLVAGFEHADAGWIWVGDMPVAGPKTHLAPNKRGIGVVAQEGTLFPHLNVADNVGFGLARGKRDDGRVHELLELVGLRGFDRRFPHELSGGEQQRVALARALAPAPALILLDEPFSALDPALRTGLRDDVRTVLQAAGTTALLVTHDQTEALSIADQVGVMRGGRLVQVSDPVTIYRQPLDAEVARFVGDAVLVPGELDNGCIRCPLGWLQVYGNRPGRGPAVAMIRPEQLVLNAEPGGFEARVVAVTYHGHDATVRLVGAGDVELLARVAGHALPIAGDLVRVSVRGDVVAFVDAVHDNRGLRDQDSNLEPTG